MSFPLEMQTVYDVALDSLQSRFDTTKLSHPVAVTPQLHHHFGSIMLLPDWVPLSEYYAMVIDARSIGKGLFSFYISSPLTRYAVSAQLGDVPNEAYDIYAFGSLDPLANLEQLPPIQAGLIQVVPRGTVIDWAGSLDQRLHDPAQWRPETEHPALLQGRCIALQSCDRQYFHRVGCGQLATASQVASLAFDLAEQEIWLRAPNGGPVSAPKRREKKHKPVRACI